MQKDSLLRQLLNFLQGRQLVFQCLIRADFYLLRCKGQRKKIAVDEIIIALARILTVIGQRRSACAGRNIKTGFLDGAVVPVSKIEELAKLPSKEVLIAQTLYSFNYPIMQLAIALNAIAEKGEADQEALVSTLVGKTEAAEEAAE